MSYRSSLKRATDPARTLGQRVCAFRSAVQESKGSTYRGWSAACETYLGPQWATAVTDVDLRLGIALMEADHRAWLAFEAEFNGLRRREKAQGRRTPSRRWVEAWRGQRLVRNRPRIAVARRTNTKPPTLECYRRAMDLWREGKPIEAVRVIREATGHDLRDARSLLDGWVSHTVPPPAP